MITTAIAAAALSAAAPSFDCAKASGVEHIVCAEPRLAALDARLAGLYRRSLAEAPTEAEATRTAQRSWLRKRNEACARSGASAPCLDGYYRSRIEALENERRRRNESLGHPPTNGTYAEFVGRWRVIGVAAADDAGEITNFGVDEPRYMGLELSAGPNEVRWLNGTKENSTTDACTSPSFIPRSVANPLPAGWKAVTLACKGKSAWTEAPYELTLKARDLAELKWDDGALLYLRRVAPGETTPPPPHDAPAPPLPPGSGTGQVSKDDKAFFLALQSAVRRHDREWFAAQGVITVNRPDDGASYAYLPDEVREAYDWIVTPEVARAVLAQKPDELFKNDQGVMVGDGAVWFNQTWTGKRWVYAIEAINQTPPQRGSK